MVMYTAICMDSVFLSMLNLPILEGYIGKYMGMYCARVVLCLLLFGQVYYWFHSFGSICAYNDVWAQMEKKKLSAKLYIKTLQKTT